MHDGQRICLHFLDKLIVVRVKRIGPEEGGLTARGLWIRGTKEHLELVVDSVNAHSN